MSWRSPKKKGALFVLFILSKGNFFKIFVWPQCVVYWMHFPNIHNFIYQKILLHTLLLLVFKIIESLQCILNTRRVSNQKDRLLSLFNFKWQSNGIFSLWRIHDWKPRIIIIIIIIKNNKLNEQNKWNWTE